MSVPVFTQYTENTKALYKVSISQMGWVTVLAINVGVGLGLGLGNIAHLGRKWVDFGNLPSAGADWKWGTENSTCAGVVSGNPMRAWIGTGDRGKKKISGIGVESRFLSVSHWKAS